MKYVERYQGPQVSFWDEFPYFMETGAFKTLYKADRSKDKNKSSKTMWYLVMVKDIDTEYYDMSEMEQKEIVCDVVDLDVIKYVGGKELDTLLIEFEDFIDTPMSADVRNLERKMAERARFIKRTPYTLDKMEYPQRKNEEGDMENVPGSKPFLVKGTAPQLDKMVVETDKLHERIRTLRASLKSEQAEQTRGGQEESFLDG